MTHSVRSIARPLACALVVLAATMIAVPCNAQFLYFPDRVVYSAQYYDINPCTGDRMLVLDRWQLMLRGAKDPMSGCLQWTLTAIDLGSRAINLNNGAVYTCAMGTMIMSRNIADCSGSCLFTPVMMWHKLLIASGWPAYSFTLQIKVVLDGCQGRIVDVGYNRIPEDCGRVPLPR